MAESNYTMMTRRILRGFSAGQSAEEVAESATNGTMTPAQVLVRAQDALKSHDPLSEAEKRRLLVWEAQQLLESIRDDAIKYGDPKARESFMKSIRLVGDMLTQADTNVHEISTKLQFAQAQVMASAISLAFEKSVFELQKRYPEVDDIVAREILMSSLPSAVHEIELNTADE